MIMTIPILAQAREVPMVFLFGFVVPQAPRFLGWLGILVTALIVSS
jgi:hypothetical protein